MEYTVNLYTDKTEKFPVISIKVKKYIMVMYVYNANSIVMEQLKNIMGPEITRA